MPFASASTNQAGFWGGTSGDFRNKWNLSLLPVNVLSSTDSLSGDMVPKLNGIKNLKKTLNLPSSLVSGFDMS